MKKNSTPLPTVKTPCNRMEVHPRRRTLNAIMQFARAYTHEPKLPGELGSFVAN